MLTEMDSCSNAANMNMNIEASLGSALRIFPFVIQTVSFSVDLCRIGIWEDLAHGKYSFRMW